MESPQGGEGTLSLTRDGESYTGTITNKRFNATTPISTVDVKGNEMTISYEVTGPGGNTMPVTIKAIIVEDTFSGSMTVGQFGAFPIKAEREK